MTALNLSNYLEVFIAIAIKKRPTADPADIFY